MLCCFVQNCSGCEALAGEFNACWFVPSLICVVEVVLTLRSKPKTKQIKQTETQHSGVVYGDAAWTLHNFVDRSAFGPLFGLFCCLNLSCVCLFNLVVLL